MGVLSAFGKGWHFEIFHLVLNYPEQKTGLWFSRNNRRLAARGHYPAIDVLSSLSRVMPNVTAKPQQAAAQRARALLATYEEKRDLIALGAYSKGSDARLDQAITAAPDLERFLCQDAATIDPSATTLQTLKALADKYPERR